MHEPLRTGDRTYDLHRWPRQRLERLRAWDTADQLLLETVGGDSPGCVLVVNDNFGALSVPLAAGNPVLWSDARVALLAVRQNLAANDLAPDAVRFVPADEEPVGTFDLVLARFPKALAFWEDTLRRLRPHLQAGSRVVAGGMIKHTPRRAFELLETIIGPTTTGLGWKKARLATAVFDPDRELPTPRPDPEYVLPGTDLVLRGGPNVFARERLDTGTSVLLPHLPQDGFTRAVDLGCGNGVLALALAWLHPDAEVCGVDASYQAVASARANATEAGFSAERVRFEVSDGLHEFPLDAFDLVVSNPPFHQDRAVSDAVAWSFFTQARRCLALGGRILVVGNGHLGHQDRLLRVFGNCRRLGADRGFEVLESVRDSRN